MRLWCTLLVLVCGTSALAQEPPKPNAPEILDAVMYIFTGIEDNTRDSRKSQPWKKEIRNSGVAYSHIGRNGIGFSDDEMNRKTRASAYVKYTVSVTTPSPCVFTIEERTDFSRGDSQTDFTAYSLTGGMNDSTFNLANAHTFRVAHDQVASEPYLIVAGPRAVCHAWGGCENAWNSAFSGLELGRFNTPTDAVRREKAVAFVKRACPGSPY